MLTFQQYENLEWKTYAFEYNSIYIYRYKKKWFNY